MRPQNASFMLLSLWQKLNQHSYTLPALGMVLQCLLACGIFLSLGERQTEALNLNSPNLWLLADLLLSSFLLVLILRHLELRPVLVALFALMMPWWAWRQPEVLLALSSPLLGTIYLLQRMHRLRWTERIYWPFALILGGLILLVNFLHPHWLLLLTALVAPCFGYWLQGKWRQRQSGWKVMRAAVFSLLPAWLWWGLSGQSLAHILPKAESGLPYWSGLLWPFGGTGNYLGSFGLFFLLYIMLSKWTNKHYSINMSRYSHQTQNGRFLRWLGIGTLFSWLLALVSGDVMLGNMLFWSFNLFMAFFLRRFWLKHPEPWAYWLGAGLLTLGLVDMVIAIMRFPSPLF